MYRLEIYKSLQKELGYDVTEIAHGIEYNTALDGSAGKLTFTLEADEIAKIECGDDVIFYVSEDGIDEKNVFTGKVFTIGTDQSGVRKITAYDSLRYLKNHDYLSIEAGKKTLHDIFVEIGTKWKFDYFDGTVGDKLTQTFKLQKHIFCDVSLYDILKWCMEQAAQGSFSTGDNGDFDIIRDTIPGSEDYDADTDSKFSGRYYFLQDIAGVLCLNEVSLNSDKNPVIIGDESLLTGYDYEVSTDKETYNEIILVQDSETKDADGKKIKKKVPVDMDRDEKTIQKWGLLSKIVNIKTDATKAEIKEYLALSLQNYNKVTRTLKINALGYPLYAGSSFYLKLAALGVACMCYVISATHQYEGGIHTMTLEVSTNPNFGSII